MTVSRQPGSREVIKITINNPTLGGQQQEPAKSPPKFVEPRNLEVSQWKVNTANTKYKRIKPTFDMLMSKYVRSAGSSSNRLYGKRPRSPTPEKFSRYVKPAAAFDKSRLGPTGRLEEYLPSSEVGKMWRVKPPGIKAGKPESMSGKSFGGSLTIGTQVLKIREPVVEPAQSRPMLAIGPNGAVNDHEASSSQAKPRDPKYTQPKWCPAGLTKT